MPEHGRRDRGSERPGPPPRKGRVRRCGSTRYRSIPPRVSGHPAGRGPVVLGLPAWPAARGLVVSWRRGRPSRHEPPPRGHRERPPTVCSPVHPTRESPCQPRTSTSSATSASSPTSTPARPPSPSASSSTRARNTRSARSTTGPRRWTTWRRSRSAASRSPPRPRRIRWHDHDLNLIDTPGPRRLHGRGRAEPARARRRRGRVRRRAAASRRSPRPSGTRPTATRVPRICFINKMDRGGADFDRVLRQRSASAWARAIAPVTVPIGAADTFAGVVDLLTREAVYFRGDQGAEVVREPDPRGRCATRWRSAARSSSRSWPTSPTRSPTTFLEGEEPDARDPAGGAPQGHARGRRSSPCCAARRCRNTGIQPLLDAVVAYLPESARGAPRSRDTHPERPRQGRDAQARPEGPALRPGVQDRHGSRTAT